MINLQDYLDYLRLMYKAEIIKPHGKRARRNI